MVKNTQGGNRAKAVARKELGGRRAAQALRVAREEGEIYAQVVRMVGGAICHAVSQSGEELCCHIRGKFGGRSKRDNFIGIGTWLLVGLREWEQSGKTATAAAVTSGGKKLLRNTDIIEVYHELDKNRLRNALPGEDWTLFTANDSRGVSMKDVDKEAASAITFSDDEETMYKVLFVESNATAGSAPEDSGTATATATATAKPKSSGALLLRTDEGTLIDVDDI